MKKIIVLMFTVIFSTVLLCGCNEKEDESVAYEDLQYGATLRQILDRNIEMCFDGRFLTDEEMNKVSDYFYAIQTNDIDLFKTTQPEYYLEYLEKNSGINNETYLEEAGREVKDSVGDSFEYTWIEVTNCGDSSLDSSITDIIDMMNTIYEENNITPSFEESVQDAKFITADLTVDSNGDEYTYSDKLLYIFNCGENIYVLS